MADGVERPWYLQIRMGEFSHCSEYVPDDVYRSQIKHWAHEAKERARGTILTQREHISSEIDRIDQTNMQLDLEEEMRQLYTESIAALTDRDLRNKLKSERQLNNIRKDGEILAATEDYERTIEDYLYTNQERLKKNTGASESLAILERLGKTFNDQAAKIITKILPPPDMEKLKNQEHDEPIVTNRLGRSPMRLGPEGPCHVMCHGWMTMVHTDEPRMKPRLAISHTTHAPKLTPRPAAVYWGELKDKLNKTNHAPAIAELLVVMLQRAADNFREEPAGVFANMPSIPPDPVVVRGVLETVEKVIRQPPFELTDLATMIKPKMGSKELKTFALALLKRFKAMATNEGKFYMEIYNHSNKNRWTIGFAQPPFPEAGFHFDQKDDNISFGVTATGTYTACANKRYGMVELANLRYASVIGFIMDIKEGSIAISIEGAKPIVVFGIGSTFDEEEQEEHAKHIRSQKLVPTFTLFGPAITKPQQPPPSDKGRYKVSAQTGGSRGRFGGSRNLGTLGNVSEGGATQKDIFNRLSSGTGKSVAEQESMRMVGAVLKGHLRTMLSINLGQCRFLHLPKDACPMSYVRLHASKKLNPSALFNNLQSHHSRKVQHPSRLLPDKEKPTALFEKQLYSWSNFPPPKHESYQAGLIITRVANRWLKNRRAKQKKKMRNEAQMQLVRVWQKFRRRKRKKEKQSARVMIKYWYGWKARKIFKLLMRTKMKYHQLAQTAIKIQCAWRVRMAKKKARQIAAVNNKRVLYLVQLVVFLQRKFRKRQRYEYKPHVSSLAYTQKLEDEDSLVRTRPIHLMTPDDRELKLYTFVQKKFRGASTRRLIARVDPVMHKALTRIRERMQYQQEATKAAIVVQTWWRSRNTTKTYFDGIIKIRRGFKNIFHTWRKAFLRKQVIGFAKATGCDNQAATLPILGFFDELGVYPSPEGGNFE